ncbi:sensor histidine kinase [Aquimarina agarivorans]|uniref:sensor histidine kinase n=1 Tax=Aquimarina agarivorans TaxID=980584 RepID=UPI000248EB17|nr:ATP-binding protein [Aquimarina agarivorans]
MSIKTLILIIINSLIGFVVLILSLLFYNQFSKVLNDRILLQLNSIKTLKQIQVENLIQSEWNDFLNVKKIDTADLDTNFKIPDSILSLDGIHDLTPYHKEKQTSIGFIQSTNEGSIVKIIPYHKLKKILLERTGMGESGESYLVGSDYCLRSQSRFFPDKNPYKVKVKTKGVIDALAGNKGRGVFKDYRGVNVYSVYSPLETSYLELVILSEIDVDEVTLPLKKLRYRLFVLTLGILIVAVLLSLLLTKMISNPVKNMRKNLKIMAMGNYNQSDDFKKNSIEIKEMFDALANLKDSLRGAVNFSNQIGNMNLNSNYTPKSSNDQLGKSLIAMRDKLLEFRTNEQKSRIVTKRLLLDGLEKERKRLSRELHDGIGPHLTSLKFYVENNIIDPMKKIEMKTIVDSTISEVRLMSNALMPSSIDDFGVGATLTNFVRSIENSTKISIEFEDLTKHSKSKITNHQGINLFRISQELINNSLKHSEAKNIRITLSEFNDFVSLFYFDDGIGFKLETAKLGSGIINIKQRVEICNGTIVINSEQGRTTTFEIEFPIKNDL